MGHRALFNTSYKNFFSTRLFPVLFQVVDIMKTNVEKVLERDQKLSELDDRAGNISSIKELLPNYPYSIFILETIKLISESIIIVSEKTTNVV